MLTLLYYSCFRLLRWCSLPANAGDTRDPSSIPGWEDPLRRKWQLTPVFLPGKFHGQRSLVGYS